MNNFIFNLFVGLLMVLVFYVLLYSGLQQIMETTSTHTVGDAIDAWFYSFIFSKRGLGLAILLGLIAWGYTEFKKNTGGKK